ncbi:GlcG/HbpS family heme-binding protein [Roseixanthobacter liquoris]|uniref:GlcG/HbpS family heme-binding protein n=1 Tax=Roseixanthobacter liquoris TaxID=3119921 RepID=UPI0037279949
MLKTLRARRLAVRALALTCAFASLPPAMAQVHGSGYRLPLALAMEAVGEAVRACGASGYDVSAAVVDASGETIAFAKGDHSTVHTKDTSFRKAYTVVTLGPIFKFESLGAFVEKMRGNPNAPAFASLPNILLLAGGVAVTANGESVAAIGVGGAPGGEKDEACAAAGLAKIKDRLPH